MALLRTSASTVSEFVSPRTLVPSSPALRPCTSRWRTPDRSSAPVAAGAFAGRSQGRGGQHPNDEDPAQSCSVFQLYPPAQISMNDVRDACEACERTRGRERVSCFETFGLRARQVDAYFAVVDDMERRLTLSAADDDAGRQVAGLGSLLFCLFVAHKLL